MEPTEDNEVAVLDVPKDLTKRIAFILNERHTVIQFLAQQSSKVLKGKPLSDEAQKVAKLKYDRLEMLLRWLSEDLQMTPQIRESTKIDVGLQVMYAKPGFKFPETYAEKAKELYERWESENWGSNAVKAEVEESSDDDADEEPAPKRRKDSTGLIAKIVDDATGVVKLRLPLANHPIWGNDGIMHGVAIKSGGRKTKVHNPNVPVKSSRNYGHNGIEVGTWYPYQLIAWIRGAHGSHQAGISGDTITGAYSIVVSGKYELLDEDQGEVLYYSGSGSHDNTDPRESPERTAATRALVASIKSGNPVRVLRSASGKSRWRPTCGIRYDGLYTVVSVEKPLNTKGGRYERFKLVRQEKQDEIDRSRPSSAEVRDYDKISDEFYPQR